MITPNNPKADDMSLIVKYFELFSARIGREAGDDVDFSDGPDFPVTNDDTAALEEVLVNLWVIEATYHGPHCGNGCVDGLNQGGAALVGSHRVVVVTRYVIWNGRLRLFKMVRGDSGGCDCGGAGLFKLR